MITYKFSTSMGTIAMRKRIPENPGEELDGHYYEPRDLKFNHTSQAAGIIRKFNDLKAINPEVQFVEAWTERPDGTRVETIHTLEGVAALAAAV